MGIVSTCRCCFSFWAALCIGVMQRLETRCHSSGTLARGMELANKPINELVDVKAELDDEERAMEREMQAGLLI